MYNGLFFVFFIISSFFLFKICALVWREWCNPFFTIDILYIILILAAYYGLSECTWYLSGVLWLTIALWSLTIGGAFGKALFKQHNRKIIAIETCIIDVHISNLAWFFLRIMIILALMGWAYQVVSNDFSSSDFTSLDSLAKMNNEVAVERYSGQSNSNVITTISTIVTYTAALCGGFLFPFAKTKPNKIVAVFSMIPIMLVMLFCNGKSGFLSCIILWGSAFLTSFFYIHKQSPKVDLSKLIGYSILAVFALAFLLFSMMLRIGHVDLETFNVVTQKFMSYAFGEIQAFDYWFELGRSNIEYSVGVQTFMAIFHSVGLIKRKQGVYGLMPGVISNVYTVFRGIIEDFGTVGGLAFVAVCGCLAGYYFEKIKYSVRVPVVSVFFVISIEFFFMYGYIISPWIYASYMAMMALFMGFTMLCKRKSIKIVCGNKVLIG